MKQLVNKTINLDLNQLDGNAFNLLGAFTRQALIEGWSDEEIATVTTEAQSDDYNHLVTALSIHCQSEVQGHEEETVPATPEKPKNSAQAKNKKQ